MAYITYELDEYQPWPGLALYCYGEATITYQWEGRDRDTGDDGGPYDIELESLLISNDKGGGFSHIDHKHPLFDALEAQLCVDRHVVEACIRDHND